MVGVTKVEIKESVEELHELLIKQKVASSRERVQALYLLKMGQIKTIQDVAVVVGRERVTVQRWLKTYTESGINGLLSIKKSTGRPPIINDLTKEQLLKELEQPEGFKSYKEIRTWLKAVEGVEASYKVVHDTVRYRMKAKLKVPRAVGIKHNEEAELEFKKNCHNT
ncbi:helix-turn-helix domain-containing protein [Nostocaceae cyanobacterium CENA357]|uniref:Helix-turn-helix domain-containing protein n=1 Tax=Atlanticothrix silvestris CENA357 TaxID=1725252 RepID=A0A8J7L6Z3_9CYAN|nr:helix-turn-helix domain-containing protein [Atlanticothrix silvestris]MBH8554617.1 helix-turn-helix domain-containing protein [Atlanticothrix silvestris CENA357]